MDAEKLYRIKLNTFTEIAYLKKESKKLYEKKLDASTPLWLVYYKQRIRKEREKLKFIKELEANGLERQNKEKVNSF